MSIVPYAPGEINPFLLASMVPEAIKDAEWAAKKIGRFASRAYKARKAKRSSKKRKVDGTTKVGEPMRLTHSKRDMTYSVMDLQFDSRTLYSQELTAVVGGDGENDRRRQLINCKGFEICIHVTNKQDQPLFVNFAILAPKHTSSGISATDFFRSNDGARGTNFSTVLTALELAYLPINTDKYTILRHMRMQLNSMQDRASYYNSDAGPGNWISKKMWLPINRQLRYDNNIATSCATPMYVVYWCDIMRQPASSAVAANVASMSLMHTMFFTDVV